MLSERNRGDVLVLCVSSTLFRVCQAGSVVDILVPVVFASSRVDSFSFQVAGDIELSCADNGAGALLLGAAGSVGSPIVTKCFFVLRDS